MELRPGTRVPIHCSASGKLFLAHLSPARRAAILDGLVGSFGTSLSGLPQFAALVPDGAAGVRVAMRGSCINRSSACWHYLSRPACLCAMTTRQPGAKP